MNFIDTHCHLDFYEDFEDVIARAKESGLTRLISVGTSISGSEKNIEIAQKYSTRSTSPNQTRLRGASDFKIYATCGIHAEEGKKDIEKFGESYIKKLKALAKSREVVAIGECGFDFKEPLDEISKEEKKFQRELFEVQIEIAKDLGLPLIIHCRNGWKETFEVLERYQGSTFRQAQGTTLKSPGVFHSWTSDWEHAKKALDLGFYIGFSGILTFKNAPLVQETAKNTPIDRILLETDAPFLSPEPMRGKKNEPKNVTIIARFLADLKKLPLEQVVETNFENARRLFRLE